MRHFLHSQTFLGITGMEHRRNSSLFDSLVQIRYVCVLKIPKYCYCPDKIESKNDRIRWRKQ